MGYSWTNNCDFFEKDVSDKIVNTFSECARSCKITKACTHFVWFKNSNRCVFKSGIVTKSDAFLRPDHQCGLLDEQKEIGKVILS